MSHSNYVRFINELGNKIDMRVELEKAEDEEDYDSVLVYARGPTSYTEHTWTRKEAEVLLNNLSMVLNRPLAE
jgi:hypothetical protein